MDVYQQFKRAIDTDNLQDLQKLISQSVDVNITDEKYISPLMAACFAGSADAVGLLLSHGANVNAKSKLGKTALDYAKQTENRAALKVLSDHISLMNETEQTKMKKIRLGILLH